MVLHPANDEEDGGVIEPLLARASSSTNATITQPQGTTEGYYTMPAPDQKYFHFDGEPQTHTPSRRHSIGGYHHNHHNHRHHDLVVAPLRPLLLPTQPRRAPKPPVVVDEDAVVRKMDRRLMPLLFLTQMLASTDAAALASAVFLGGLSEDAHLQGCDYRALSAWFYIGYLLWAYPTCFFLSTLSTGGPAATHGKRGRSASNSSSFYTSMYSAGSSESLSLFFLSSASDSSSIMSTSSDSSSFASVYSWDSESPNNKKGAGAGGGGGNGAGDGYDDENDECISFGVARYLGLDTLAWGAAVAATTLTTHYAGLVAARFLLGAAEATVIPALMLVTSTWYARDEVPLRTGIWFAGSAAGDVVATVLGHILVLLHGIGSDIENGNESKHAVAAEPNSGSSDFAGGGFGFSFFFGILPEWNPWRWIFVLLGVATFLWGFVILYRLLDPASSSDGSSAAFPGSVAERQWDLDRVAAAETTSKQLWARSSHVRPRPVPDWKWRQARDCLGDPQTWLVAAMSLLCQVPQASTRGLADLVLLGPNPGSGSGDAGSSAPTTMPMALQITYMLITMAAMIGSGWLASRFRSLSCTLLVLAALPPLIGSACIAKQLHYPSDDTRGNSLLDDDTWPPSPTRQMLASMLLCTLPAVMPLLLSLIQVNVRGLTKKTTTQALALAAYCVGHLANLASPRLFVDNAFDETFPAPPRSDEERRASKEASYHTAVHTVVACSLLIAICALTLRAYLRRRNRAKQDSEMAEVIDAIETRGGVTEYSLYRGAVDDEGNQVAADEFDDMTDWKIPGFQYRY
ncbi:MFS general substrate transporter [Apiospora saccharicola]|uniref:MFS general substrate transporter n=1 Tax=Apiospora saccharicola TaxID=335842 RepID=A0ABR1U394_9PEZI